MFCFKFCIPMAIGIASVHAGEAVHPPRDPAYRLVWSDEFDIDGPPDSTKWVSETGFKRNRELQWYQAENSRCQDGFLIIEARKEKVENPDYQRDSRHWSKSRKFSKFTSGSLVSTDGYVWHFGRSEVRARFKARPGLWPAIWTTGKGPWPHAGEIDIMEFYQEQILANFVWAGKGGRDHWVTSKHPIEDFGKDTWDEKFHVWVAEWDEERIAIYLDGKLLNTLPVNEAVNKDGPAIKPFLHPQHFRLNLAIGGQGGDPSATSFPQRYEIDYVRIYEKAPAD